METICTNKSLSYLGDERNMLKIFGAGREITLPDLTPPLQVKLMIQFNSKHLWVQLSEKVSSAGNFLPTLS